MHISTALNFCNDNLNTKITYSRRELVRSVLKAGNAWRSDWEVQNRVVSLNQYVTEEIDDKWFDVYLSDANCITTARDSKSNCAVKAVEWVCPLNQAKVLHYRNW